MSEPWRSKGRAYNSPLGSCIRDDLCKHRYLSSQLTIDSLKLSRAQVCAASAQVYLPMASSQNGEFHLLALENGVEQEYAMKSLQNILKRCDIFDPLQTVKT
jgi:hypothetical protein